MADIPRLNGVIRALEAGKPAFTSFCQADPETAIAMTTAKYDGIVFEMEHNPWDIRALRDCLQYMLNRGQIAKAGSVAPASRRWCASRRTASRRRSGTPSRRSTSAATASCGRTSRPWTRPTTRSPPAAIRA